MGLVAVACTYDADHVRATHRHLFQDVYEWAGEFRSDNKSKGVGRSFGDIRSGEVNRLPADVRQWTQPTARRFARLTRRQPEGNHSRKSV